MRFSHALVPNVPRALRALLPHVSYVLFYIMYLVPCVYSCCLSLVLHVLFCFSSLTCFKCFKPKVLYITYLLYMHLKSRSFHVIWLLWFCCLTRLSFLLPGLRLIIVICRFLKRNSNTMVFCISDISLQDLLTSLH